MGALPKRKISKARQGERRSHLALSPTPLSLCPQCHSPKLQHRVCPVCGHYKGREAVAAKVKKAKT